MPDQLQAGDFAPDFSLPVTASEIVTLTSFRGKNLVLFFYPRDNTTGCTAEAKDFSARQTAFNETNTTLLGISRDSIASHNKFKEAHSLTVNLASDKDGEVCKMYGVLVEKKMYGRVGIGIERSTFLINEDGKIEEIWRKVKVAGHADSVLQRIISG